MSNNTTLNTKIMEESQTNDNSDEVQSLSKALASSQIDSLSKHLPIETKVQELYGGALTCEIPNWWRDVSQVRQVPDHQEVFQDCSSSCSNREEQKFDGDSHTGIVGSRSCIVIEILERENAVANEKAASFFWNDLADANCASAEKAGDRALLKERVICLNDEGLKEGKPSADDEMQMSHHLQKKLKNIPKSYACFCLGKQLVVGAGMRESDPRAKDMKEWVQIQMCILRLETIQTDLLISVSTPFLEKENDAEISNAFHKYSSTFSRAVSTFTVIDWSLFA